MPDEYNEAIEVLRHINAEAAINLAQALNQLAWHPEYFRLGAMGLGNVGKSTTLNALIRDANNATFASDVIPTTKSLQRHLHEGIELMDTPGLDVKSEDDAIAFEGLKHCDVLLLVHPLTTGELDAVLLNALKTLSAGEPGSLAKRLIAVWTCAGEVSLGDEPGLAKKLTDQLRDATNGCPLQVSVDNMTYMKALRHNKSQLMAHSGIPTLMDVIQKMQASNSHVYEAREARRCHQLKQGLAILEETTSALQQEKETHRQAILRAVQGPLDALATYQLSVASLATRSQL